MKFGVDTGGTFTDVVARDAGGALRVFKLLSTPEDPSQAIATGVSELDASLSGEVVHGTTVATNALLERRGCRVAFVTTAGFEDLLVMRRQNRPDLYALRVVQVAPLTDHCVGVRERIAHDGSVIESLTDDALQEAVDTLVDLAPEAVAICLLHSYANGAHERRLADAVARALPGRHISVSSELVGEFREFERASTTVVNAFVGPVMSSYIESLGRRLRGASVEILESSGGRASLPDAAHAPVHTVLSGPAGGVLGARAAARDLNLERIITFDMGGTSTDVSLCEGEPSLTYSAEIADHPLRIPTLDILTVGAGGGSIAYADPGGALRVGPQSAGSSPGPAAYGRGGEQPTVTDAHVLLGSLRPDMFLGGEMPLHPQQARAAIGRLASELGMEPEETARGILAVADASMVRAIKVICSRRGRDPRDFSLVAFGGAGGLHGCRLAEMLGVATVIVPHHPGLLSAFGMLHAPRMRLYAEAVMRPLDESVVRAACDRLRERASGDFGEQREFRLLVDLRYTGQSFEIPVGLDSVPTMRRAFALAHEDLYGYSEPGLDLELVAVRLAAVEAEAPRLGEADSLPVDAAPESVWIDLGAGPAPTSVVDRSCVGVTAGPAIVTEYSGTTIVPAGWTARTENGHLVLRRTG